MVITPDILSRQINRQSLSLAMDTGGNTTRSQGQITCRVSRITLRLMGNKQLKIEAILAALTGEHLRLITRDRTGARGQEVTNPPANQLIDTGLWRRLKQKIKWEIRTTDQAMHPRLRILDTCRPAVYPVEPGIHPMAVTYNLYQVI
ncbi:MAG: hypothetical protein V3V12_09125 [Gammaproteobacteria bacterium]